MDGSGRIVGGIRNAYSKNNNNAQKSSTAMQNPYRYQDGVRNRIIIDDRGRYVKGENLAGFNDVSTGNHPENNSWNYRKVRYEAPNPSSTQYEGIVNFGVDKNGDKNFYSITDIKQNKKATIPN